MRTKYNNFIIKEKCVKIKNFYKFNNTFKDMLLQKSKYKIQLKINNNSTYLFSCIFKGYFFLLG